MARSARLVLAALAAAPLASVGLRVQEVGKCEEDEVAFAKMTTVTCMLNWALKGDKRVLSLHETQHQGCWDMLEYNTDKFLSSAVYQNSQDGRCALIFSGYHGALAGYTRGVGALVWPPETWDVCGGDMYAPYVRLIRHHFSLANWSKIVRTIGGAESKCKGELTFAAESMGGSAGEMMAQCANAGRLYELQDPELPGFTLQTLYTYGASAASVEPMTNALREDGCFKGKRIFLSRDPVAHYGALFNLKHPRQDAVEIWNNPHENPSIRSYSCRSDEATIDGNHKKPPPIVADLHFNGTVDQIQHEVTTYWQTIDWMQQAGKGSIFDAEPMQDAPPETSASKYLEHLQKRG